MYKKFIIKLFITLTFVCIICFSFLATNLQLLSLGLLAFILGLRHGFDADHIVAIDNITRKLQSEQKEYRNTKYLNTGMFFALGHSTVVMLLTILIILSLQTFHNTFMSFKNLGSTIGVSVSICFLWMTALINVRVLSSLVSNKHNHVHPPRGILNYLARYLFNKINSPAKMYLVGFCFGLGFDTATEVGLLSLAATSYSNGLELWLILLFPVLFASGMILTDSLNCVFMASLYNWASNGTNQLRKYNIVIIGITTFLAFAIGLFELIEMLNPVWHWPTIIINISKFINVNSAQIGIGIACGFMCLWVFTRLRLKFKH